MYRSHNYVTPSVSNRLLNFEYAGGSINVIQNFKDLNYGVTYSGALLGAQASVFSDQLMSIGGLMDFRKIFSSSTFEGQKLNAYQLYIYSYAKSLFYGLNYAEITFIPERSPVFVGHGILFKLLVGERFTTQSGEFVVNSSVTMLKSDGKAVLDRLLQDFDFLKGMEGKGVSGGKTFFDSRFDSMFNKLYEASNDISVDLKSVNPSANNRVGNEQEVADDQPGSVDNKERTDFRSGNDEQSKSKENLSKPTIAIGQRILEIFYLDDSHLSDFVSPDSNPLGNSCLDLSQIDSWLYVEDRTVQLSQSISHFIPRANLIFLRNPATAGQIGPDNSIFSRLPRQNDFDILIQKDVWAITNLTCHVSMNAKMFQKYDGKDLSSDLMFTATPASNPPSPSSSPGP